MTGGEKGAGMTGEEAQPPWDTFDRLRLTQYDIPIPYQVRNKLASGQACGEGCRVAKTPRNDTAVSDTFDFAQDDK